jgi:hypothetical protein
VLESIRSVTYTVPDLAPVEQAYTRWLRYRVVDRGSVPESMARACKAPSASGLPSLTLGPESGEPVHLRFVQDRGSAGWRALTTHGWNCSEIVVRDVDALAGELADSPFRIIGPPTSLQRFPMIRAMQVIGPSGECLYLTQIGPGSGLRLPRAQSFVGRVFIVVAGGADLPALFRTYEEFGNEFDAPVATRVRVISLANGLPPETEHWHGLVKLGDGGLIELDRYPDVTRPRPRTPGALPQGMALVTFTMRGHGSSRVIEGAAGELIELTEVSDA